MAWRVVAIENPAKLSFKDNKLIIKQGDEVALPLEDIDSLVIDNREIILSTNIISALSHFGVNTIICDEKHLPSTVILPHGQASRGAKTPEYSSIWARLYVNSFGVKISLKRLKIRLLFCVKMISVSKPTS